jgi:AhpD family alkylhydroperoxidase
MTNFKTYTAVTAPDASQSLLKQITDNIGFTPNIFAVTAESTHALSGLMAINNAFSNSSFTAQEQQVIFMATSVTNGCGYCVAGHTLMATGLGISEEVIHALRNQKAVSDPRYAILRQMVGELIIDHGHIAETTMSEFLRQGYSKAQFFELVLGVSVKTFTNYVSNAITLTLDKAFKPYQWQRPQEIQISA